MIEREIERRVMDAVSGLPGMDDVQILGAWQPGDADELLNMEDTSAAKVYVRAGQRQFESFGFCKCEIPVAVALSVRLDEDTTGELLNGIYEKLMDLLQTWHIDQNGELRRDLSVDGFNADGLSIGGGSPPEIDDGTRARKIALSFSVVGSVEH